MRKQAAQIIVSGTPIKLRSCPHEQLGSGNMGDEAVRGAQSAADGGTLTWNIMLIFLDWSTNLELI
jgi:hypothetical protein